jgi:hypothetical protein
MNFDQQLQVQEQTETRMLGKEQRMEERQRAARQEERQEAQEAAIATQERDINKNIRSERQKLIQFQNQKVKPIQDIQATQNKLIDLEIEKADLRGLAFDSNEDYQKAKDAGTAPPAGTIIYVGRKRVKVK